MSSGKTETLGLNQWQLSDAFLMEEMNEDNRRVDAAVAAVPYVKLLDVTTKADAAQVELDLSGIDLSSYLELHLIAVPQILSTDDDAQIFVKLNGGEYCVNRPQMSGTGTSAYNYAASFFASTATGYVGSFKMVLSGSFASQSSAKNAVLIDDFSGNMSKSRSNQIEWYSFVTYITTLTSLSFVPTDATTKLAAGSKFVLFGVRI